MIRRGLRALSLVSLIAALGIGLPTAFAQDEKPPATALAATAKAGAAGGPGAPAATFAPAVGGASGTIETKGPSLRLRQSVPRPKPPSKPQLKAFDILTKEAKDYETGAKAYRRTLTQIVRYHYEERRRRVLAALDRDIKIERQGLENARNEAISRIERFIVRYSGTNADQEATPDAMFRLAALYEERGRDKADVDLAPGLEPAIQLYKRIIREYPKYEEIAAVHYYLGHALTDAERLEEGQQAFRSLVCSNRYTVKDDPKGVAKIIVEPLPQDHDPKYWQEWDERHPVPLDQVGVKPRRGVAPARGGAARDEISFADPYADCTPLAQKTLPGDEPRYVAESFWQLGNYHFDQLDPSGGPFNLNRAVSAYSHSMQFKKPPIYGVALYKQAWTYFKQQRYQTAVKEFVNLLGYADEQEAKTGDPGADFRAEAYTYIAGSLTYVDFDGPPADHPYISRNDVLDTEPNPVEAERKMGIAITRVQDPALIPQD
jgi:tetratricopeptide (TPR) repeat protein